MGEQFLSRNKVAIVGAGVTKSVRHSEATIGGLEVPLDPQVRANGYARTRSDREGREYLNVVSPVRAIDEPDVDTRPAPQHGEHTDEVLLEAGLSWDDLIELKLDGAIL